TKAQRRGLILDPERNKSPLEHLQFVGSTARENRSRQKIEAVLMKFNRIQIRYHVGMRSSVILNQLFVFGSKLLVIAHGRWSQIIDQSSALLPGLQASPAQYAKRKGENRSNHLEQQVKG